MAAYRRVYDSHHLQADCQEPGSAPEPYARQSSMGYLFSVRRTSFSWAVCALLMRLHTHRIVFNYNGLFSLSNRKQGLIRNLCVRFFLVYRYYSRCPISSLAAENVSLSFHMRGENTSDVTSNFSRKRVVLTDMLHQACLSICGKKTIWRRFVSLKGQSAQPDHLKLPQRQLCVVLYIHTYIHTYRKNESEALAQDD